MVDFKAKNSAAIAKARAGLEEKIANELEAQKKEEDDRGEETQKNAETTVASPTKTTTSWLNVSSIITCTLGVRTLH